MWRNWVLGGGMRRTTELERTIIRSDLFVSLRSFLESAQRLINDDPSVANRLARRLKRIEDGQERGRKKLEGTSRNLYRTRVDDDRRLIDEPLTEELSGRVALLLVAHHDEAYRWAGSYSGDTMQRARDTLVRAVAANLVPPATTQRELLRVAEAPPDYGVAFGSVLTRLDLDDLHIPLRKQAAVLEALVQDGGKGLGLSTRQRASIKRRYEERRLRPRRNAFVPAVEAREVLVGSAEEIAAILRGPLTQFLAVLSDQQRSIVKRDSDQLLVVHGAAGTGKTIVGVLRAKRWIETPQLQHNPVLYTCYNRVLARSVRQLLRDAVGRELPDDVAQVETAYRLLLRVCGDLDPTWSPELVDSKRLLPAVRGVRQDTKQTPALAAWRAEDVLQEILDVIFGRAILRERDYIEAGREGRGRKRMLSREKDRPVMWRMYQAIRKAWAAEGIAPWEQVPARACGLLAQHPPRDAAYHGIVIDEVQDLPPSVIRAFTLLQGTQGHTRMMLLGDPAQSVYRSPFRWAHAGLPKTGSVVTLRRCFRSTPRIVQAAAPLIACQQERFGDDLVLPEAEGEHGPKVTWHDADSPSAEGDWIAATIADLVNDGANPATIAVLSNDRVTRAIVQLCIEQRGIPVCQYESSPFNELPDLNHPSVKVLTISSAKGLEFPVVFVAAITEKLFPSKDNDSERSDLARRRLFTAMTRAGRRLYLSATRNEPSQLWSELALDHLEGEEERAR